MRSVIRTELGGDIEEFFDEWDWEPLGAASLAQCHKAKIKGTDNWVAVKVQHAPVKHTGKHETNRISIFRLTVQFQVCWTVHFWSFESVHFQSFKPFTLHQKDVLFSVDRPLSRRLDYMTGQFSAHLDLMLMEFGVLQVAQMFPEFKLAWLARTTRNNLPKELDFLHEAQNTEKIRYMLKDLKFLKIPKINYR